MELIMVCLGRPEDVEKGTRLHQLLNTLLSDTLTPEEKIKAIKHDYNIVTTVELEGGLATMCNLSDHIEEKAIQRGISEERFSNLRAVMENLNLTAEQAMDVLNVPQEERAQYMAKL